MFLWNNLWSVSRYIMGTFSDWWRLVGRTSPVSNPPTRKCRSGIGDHRFTFFMDLPPNYTFYTNLTYLVHCIFAYRRCDKPDNVQFMKSWENYATLFDAGLRTPDVCKTFNQENTFAISNLTIFQTPKYLNVTCNYIKITFPNVSALDLWIWTLCTVIVNLICRLP